MIVHHFRMFTMRAWNLTTGFDEDIENAVDYDMFLKLSEVGKFKHINKICYNRVLHGENTSIKKLGVQKKNHFIVVNNALKRQGITTYNYSAVEDNDTSRKFSFVRNYKSEIDELSGKEEPKNNSLINIGMVFSIIYPDKLDKLLKRINNIFEYNKNISAIVIHCNSKFANKEIIQDINDLSKDNQVEILLNFQDDYTDYKYRQAEYHLNNFKLLESKKIKGQYFIFDNADSMHVLPNSYNHICNYQIGAQPNVILGYWKDRVFKHQTLIRFVQNELAQPLESLKVKGAIHGMFLEYPIARQVFSIINSLVELCRNHNDFPEYLTDEIWFHLAVLILEKQQKILFRRTTTLTYLPWDRKLLWTEEQIAEARLGRGLSENKYIINKV